MLEILQEFGQDFVRSFGLRDLLDVLLVSAVFFVVLGWLREQLSRNMLVAVSAFVGLYVAARLLRLYMVELVFRGLFIVILLAVVIVFQADIRRLVERIGIWITRGRIGVPTDGHTIDTLVQAAEGMAESKTGALIAIRGREEWERLIDGGVQHGGRVSLPLLYSLFNPSSPAHDGAVLMEGSRITRFGAHLPLSKNLNEVGEHGTRHSAALGLAEACDAFVIVVSEERGTTSVAYDNRLVPVESASDLKGRLETFWRTHYETPREQSFTWWSRKKFRTAALSVSLAMLAWFLFVFEPGLVYRTLTAPVELRNLPTDWSLAEPSPSEVRVTLSGPQAAFQMVDRTGLAVSLDLSDIHDGMNEFVVGEDLLALPPDMELYDAEPDIVLVEAERLEEVSLPVQIRMSGALPDSVVLAGVAIDPDSVDVLMPGDAPREPVVTDSIDISGITEPTTVTSGLVLPSRGRWPNNEEQEVAVHIETRVDR